MGVKRIGIECFAVVAVLSVFFVPAEGIKCYQCISTNNSHPFQCNEFLTSDIDMVPTSCDGVFGAQYCVKHVGRFEDGIGTKRFCSAVHLGNYCDYVQNRGDTLEYRTCLYTCTGDGCNPASAPKPTSIVLVASCLILFSLFSSRR